MLSRLHAMCGVRGTSVTRAALLHDEASQLRKALELGWVKQVHGGHYFRVTEAGLKLLKTYQTVVLTCRFCEASLGLYVAKQDKTRVLRRTCRVCGSGKNKS